MTIKSFKNPKLRNSQIFFCSLAVAAGLATHAVKAQSAATISIQADQPGVQISSNLFGIFFEEINFAGEGGIYDELVRNRNFEEPVHTNHWQYITSGSANGSLNADSSVPLNGSNLYSAVLTFSSGSGSVGMVNNGWWGMNFEAGHTYDLNLYARRSAIFGGTLSVQLQNATGTVTYGQGTITNLSPTWQHHSLSLVANASDPDGRLVLTISRPGSVWMDVVSLFPRQTFHNRTNGLRLDLANMLDAMHPSFMRFPGGNYVEGNVLADAFRWKNTIGDIATRPGHFNSAWGYWSTDGLGYLEYLKLCEDLHCEPLFVINCGLALGYNGSTNNTVPLDQMGPWVQDALDAIQYANGDTNTYWGARRAADGHPAPFHLKYVEIGNENGGGYYNDRYALFYDAIKANYPDMHLIACVWGGIPTSRPVEIMDEHYYSNPGFFEANANRYDSYSRSGPKVYVGEYAVTSGAGTWGNLAAALGEAAFMTGMERNSDVVEMASYAPLFANANDFQWKPDMIYYNSSQAFGTPSYYVQKMFSRNRGDEVLPTAVSITSTATNVPPHGAIGLGSWNTAVQYTNLVVTSNGVPIYQSDFSSGASGWRVYNGSWSTSGGVYQQTAITTDCRSTTGDTSWANYTITLRARKISGNEGFLIIFNWLDDNNYTWWNIGGWNNTLDGIEQSVNGSKSLVGPQVTSVIPINNNQWYDIRIVLNGAHIQCYLNNVLVHDVYYPSTTGHEGAVGLGTWNTAASFTNLVVTKNGQTNFQSDFSSGASSWQVYKGSWSTSGGVYKQTAITTDCRSTVGDTHWNDYTITLKARKDSGNEGFLILFNWQDDNNWTWWNIGGWNNTQDAIEQMVNGSKSIIGQGIPESIQTGVWYDIRIVLSGNRIQCYLNNVLIHDVTYPSISPLYASASYAKASGQVIVKAVNTSGDPVTTTFNLNGLSSIGSQASLEQLTSGSPLDENSLVQPMKVAPINSNISVAGTNFIHTFPANSLSILRLQTPPTSPAEINLDVGTNANDLTTLPNGIPVSLSSFITNNVSVDFTIEAADGSVVTNGALEFVPGILTTNIEVPGALLNPGTFFRVTLSNPTNCQLGNVSRAYFVQDSAPGGPLKLGIASYPDEKLVYWTDPAATLLMSTNLAGPWISLSNTVAPVRIPESQPTEFFELTE